MPMLGEQHVEVDVLRQRLVHPQRLAVEPDALGRAVVRADDRGVAARRAGADVVLLDHRHTLRAELLGQVVSGGHPVRAAADHHEVVRVLQLARVQVAVLAQEADHAATTPSGSPRSSTASQRYAPYPQLTSRSSASPSFTTMPAHSATGPQTTAPAGSVRGRASSSLTRAKRSSRAGPPSRTAAQPQVRSTASSRSAPSREPTSSPGQSTRARVGVRRAIHASPSRRVDPASSAPTATSSSREVPRTSIFPSCDASDTHTGASPAAG